MDAGTIVNLEDGDYGKVILKSDGAEGKPIVYRSESGRAIFKNIDMTNRQWVHLDGVTVNGGTRLKNTRDCVVRNCKVSGKYGITAYKPGTYNTLIEDNVVTGIRPWKPILMGAKGENSGEGIQITGSGNVVRYNRVTGFRDCLSHMEDKSAVVQMCNDWHNNDVIAGLDDGIEADFADSNCRVYENRITNCFVGISSQPGLGGPNYFYRNVMYNVIGYAFKLHRHSEGDVILHNTVVKMGDGMAVYSRQTINHLVIRNNLFIGGRSSGIKYGGYIHGIGRAIKLLAIGDDIEIDFNAYGSVDHPFEADIEGTEYQSLPLGPYEKNGINVGLDALDGVPYPDQPQTLYDAPRLVPSKQQRGDRRRRTDSQHQ